KSYCSRQRGSSEMNNCKFLQHPHYCIVCNSNIDMKKLEVYVSNCMHYDNNESDLILPRVEDQPIVVRDYGNDVDIACCDNCFFTYLFACELVK
ncbi:MAG: hypothetical protein ACJ72J_08755, partial [Nitrososphaeraceae archaeon]